MDVREAILERLVAIAKMVDGINQAKRNDPPTSDTALPAISILDADEEAPETDPAAREPDNAPRRVTLLPEIHIMVAQPAKDAGKVLNGYRAALVKAIFQDDALRALLINKRGVAYLGASTAFGAGRQMTGTMSLQLGFTYLLKPDDL